ncbi:CotH kinase family protein [Lysinibacillus fusiformis]|uniref:CotH kinase family protein n=1 Tax=Lysinibacillus fusiformis TaxID=28031 RepID=UPI0021C18979|nr:CotH kinase family protein [Lysinibacillus fusiformis]UXJ68885.1 CotH kinase family protein [Lysinibacillus fusiformis]
MIKTRIVYLCMAILLLLFVVIYAVLPNVGIETKNTEFSYENIIFNKNKVTTVDIEIAEEDWADMLENAADEELKQADITVNGKKIENVAIRTKGNLTLRSVINSDSDRYSLKIDFDYYDDTQSLYGLKKLNLNNNYSDSTLMREYISYEFMEQMGLPTPAHSYMYVTVNGEERGLFLGVEAVDETFLANNYGSNNGFLFKPDGTGSDLKYISDDMTDYTGIGLKTNKDNMDQSKFVEMLDAINNGGDIEKYLDVDEMLRYFAVNTALVNLDSYQGNMKHNYYLYEQNGKFSIIPWDYNMSFGGFGAGGGGMGMGTENRQKPVDASNSKSSPMENNGQTDQAGVDRQQQNGQFNMDMGMSGNLMSESAINFSVTTPVSGTTLEERPLLNALLSNEKYRAQYEGYLKELTTNYLTEDYVQSMTKKLAVLLTTYVEADPTKFSTTEQFLEAVEGENSLPEFAKQRSESILKQLSGELVVEASTTSQGMMPIPNENGEMNAMPDNFDPSQLPENFDPSQGPPFNKEGNGPGRGEGPNGGPMQRPDEKGAPMGMPGANNEIADLAASIDKTTVITIIASLVLLLLSLLFVYRFKRRGY